MKSLQELIREPVNLADISSDNQTLNLQNTKANKVEISDQEDEFYRINGRKIHLVRSLEKIAVRSRSGQSVSIMSSLNAIGQQKGAFVVDCEIPEFGITVLKTSGAESVNQITASISLFNEIPGIESAAPVYINAESGLEQIPTEQFIVKLADGTSLERLNALNEAKGVSFVRGIKGTNDQFILEIPGCTPEKLLATCEAYCQDAAIEWAEPDFLGQIDNFGYTPNDPLFDEQWYLKKIGVPQAWGITTGSDQIIIAVLDDGFDLQHEDLKGNLPSNSGEIAGNGIDDDGNGYVDDINGWDFYNNDRDPSPDSANDNHGTSVAGLAVAKGDNNLGIAGCAFNCKLMPIIVSKEMYVPSQMIEGIYYAAGFTPDRKNWRGADVISISFGISESTGINEALTAAANQGRGGKGCPIFCASGNSAGAYGRVQLPSISGAWAGRWSWVISYMKDGTVSEGDDTAWISEFVNADGAVTRFDSLTVPEGWALTPFNAYGFRGWYIEDDPSHAYGTSRYQLRCEDIGDTQEALVLAPEFTTTNSIIPGISFMLWLSCEEYDIMNFYIYNHSDHGLYGPLIYIRGAVIDVEPMVSYPARHAHTIAVGASTDLDYRSDYSCYGPELDFVVPSNGGTLDVITTDRTGSAGYESGKYTSFGGTSATAPLAAGVGGLLLSNDPNMTASEVRNTMRNSCDKIGNVEYPSNTNTYYGYGRLNAASAFGQMSSKTAEYQVTASEDDGYTWSSSMQNLDADNMKTGAHTAYAVPYYMSAIRFNNIDIPQGAIITSASLKICAFNTDISSPLFGVLKAEAADNAESFSDSHRISSLVGTSASMNWDHDDSWSPNEWLTSPNISAVIKEVVDRGGWTQGNSLVIIYATRSAQGGNRRISTFDRGAEYAPKLEITYVP